MNTFLMIFKRIMIVLVCVAFLGAGWLLINKFMTIRNAHQKPKIEKQI